MDESEKTWLGTSMCDMCNGLGPWSFDATPITPSKYHTVLYELPLPSDSPPRPHRNLNDKHWDEDYVRMPYSTKSLFIVKENGQEVVKPRWNIIREALSKPINSSEDLECAICTYNNKLPRLKALHYFFQEILGPEEDEHFFNVILPGIINLALKLPDILPGNLPLLKKNHCKSVSLSQLQISSLLANSFLCTFPWKKDLSTALGTSNFIRLYTAQEITIVGEKLKCICHYFRRVLERNPTGCVTFERKFIPKSHMPRWDNLENNLGNTKIHIDSSGVIEDAHGLLQVDFANKNIGGGVLGRGCVQEEIRFVICPELIISRLFVEQLGDYEAVTITGAERFSNYIGYGHTFQWNGNAVDTTPYDKYRRRKTSIVVIDATHFNRSMDQFHPSAILRELNKAYVGFNTRLSDNIAPVATGNWGCGAFNGDLHLKSIIQLMACNASRRNLVYYSFGNEEFKEQFYNFYEFLALNQITICQLWRYLCRFCVSNLSRDKLYSYIQQSHFDSKTQLTIKHFFIPKKNPNPTPSSSHEIEDMIIEDSEDEEIAEKMNESHKNDMNETLSTNKCVNLIEKNTTKKDLIEEQINRVHESVNECSFLEEIDRLKRKPITDKIEADTEQPIKHEVIEIDRSFEQPIRTKKKITDYFTKGNS